MLDGDWARLFFGMLLPGIESVNFDFDAKSLNAAGEALLSRLGWISGTLVLGFIIILFLARYVTPKAAAWSRLVLTGHEQDASEGYVAGASPSELPPPGTKGEALSPLRPGGKILIDDAIYDAITSGEFIEKGEPLVVAGSEGGTIIVAREK